jgi:hypothetical protein
MCSLASETSIQSFSIPNSNEGRRRWWKYGKEKGVDYRNTKICISSSLPYNTPVPRKTGRLTRRVGNLLLPMFLQEKRRDRITEFGWNRR